MQKNEDMVDLSILMSYTDGNKDDMDELIKAFHETVSEAFEHLSQSVKENDDHKWQEAIHKLQGSFSYIGARKARSLCESLGERARIKQNEKRELYKKLESLYAQICQFLEE